MNKTLDILGFRVTRGSLAEIAAQCARDVLQAREGDVPRKPIRVVALNPEKVMACRDNPELSRFVNAADVLIADGVGICIAARVLARTRLERVAGSDMMPALCAQAERLGLSVYLYGATPEVNERAAEELRRRHPGLRISGRASGYGGAEAQRATVEEIVSLKPDMVFVALGSPRQEIVIDTELAKLDIGLVQGVGGTFDVLAGQVKRAPVMFRAVGLEWFYRLLAQPTRWRRQLALVSYMRLVVRTALGN
jgi:N-acetylglucosaminyldiphosphoundecaprenol N-acetyl-beta-D-mannosaminyltransferase